jgi:biotin transport system ATP-binding protein
LGTYGIQFDNVGFARGDRQILRALTLRLEERRIGIIGNNGSGKSTLLRLINGLLLPDSGQVLVDGRDTAGHRKMLPTEIGFVFQNPDHQILFPTVGEELTFTLTERGIDKRTARQRADAFLKMFDCDDWAERPVHELSEGQKQLVCILAVLVAEPRAILLDEPFSSLDLPTRVTLMSRLLAQSQHIIMASHDLDLLGGFDRVVWLDDGRVIKDGTPSEIIPLYRSSVQRLRKVS